MTLGKHGHVAASISMKMAFREYCNGCGGGGFNVLASAKCTSPVCRVGRMTLDIVCARVRFKDNPAIARRCIASTHGLWRTGADDFDSSCVPIPAFRSLDLVPALCVAAETDDSEACAAAEAEASEVCVP